MVKAFVDKDNFAASRQTPGPKKKQDLRVQTTPNTGLQYVTLDRGTLLHKGVDQCFEKDDRPGLNPVWFSSADAASIYTGKYWVRRQGVHGFLCTYRTLKPLRLLLINKNNIRRLYDLAMEEFTRLGDGRRFGNKILTHTHTIFPHDNPRETRALPALADLGLGPSALYLLASQILGIQFTPAALASAYIDWRHFTNTVLPEVREALKQAATRFYDRFRDTSMDLTDRNSMYDEDRAYSRDFCQKYAFISEGLQLDGYYAVPMRRAHQDDPDSKFHEEIMLCKPFEGDKLKLISRVRFGDTIPEGERRNFLGTVKTAEQHEKELRSRARVQFWSRRGGTNPSSRLKIKKTQKK